MNLKGTIFENTRLGMEIYVYEIGGKVMFIGKNIADILGYPNPSTAVSENINPTHKIKKYVKTIENIEGDIIVYNNNMTLISKQGVLQLIGKSRKLTQSQQYEWYKAFGIDNVLVSRKEIEFGSILYEALNELNIQVESQYNVDGYRIDFYIPKLNVAVEYDEKQHFSKTNMKKDLARQKYIEDKLNCKFIRCDYRDSDIKNLMRVLKEIM